MLAYGKLSKDMMNNGYVGCKLGFEFSGLLSGKRVMGVAKQAVATHVFARDYLVCLPIHQLPPMNSDATLLIDHPSCCEAVAALKGTAEGVAFVLQVLMMRYQTLVLRLPQAWEIPEA